MWVVSRALCLTWTKRRCKTLLPPHDVKGLQKLKNKSSKLSFEMKQIRKRTSRYGHGKQEYRWPIIFQYKSPGVFYEKKVWWTAQIMMSIKLAQDGSQYVSVFPWLDYFSCVSFSVPPQDPLSFNRIFAREVSWSNYLWCEPGQVNDCPFLSGNFARRKLLKNQHLSTVVTFRLIVKRISKRRVKTNKAKAKLLQLTYHNKHTMERTNQNSKAKRQCNPSNLQKCRKTGTGQFSLGLCHWTRDW